MSNRIFGRISKLKRGLSLVEVGLSLGLMGFLGSYVVQSMNDQTQAQKAAAAADMMSTIHEASNAYIRTYYQQLLVSVPADGVTAFAQTVGRTTATGAVPPGTAPNLPSLQAGGFLPPSFIDRDAMRMNHLLLIRQPAAGILEGLVIQTDAFSGVAQPPIRDVDLGRMVARMGSFGGARFTTNLNAANAGTVVGNAGSWSTTANDWASSLWTPQVGRAAATVAFGTAGLSSDYLNRYDVGVPEANTMRASVNMGNNDINAARNFNATGNMINQGQIVAGMSSNLGHSESLVMSNGGYACASDIAGCTFWISNDGGFTDNNDGFITFQGTSAGKGLRLSGPGNSLLVDGDSMVSGNSHVNGNFQVDGNITTSSTITANSDINAYGSFNTRGNVNSAGDMNANGNVNASGTIYSAAGISTRGDIYAVGNMTGNGYLSIAGNGNFGGAVGVNGDLYSGGNLGVNGIVQTNSTITSMGAIYSAADVGAGGNLNAGQNVYAGNSISAGNGISAGGNLVVGQSGRVGLNLYVGNQMHADGAIGSSQQLIADDYIMTRGSNLYAPNGGLQVMNDITSGAGNVVAVNGYFPNEVRTGSLTTPGTVNAGQLTRLGQTVDDIARGWAIYCYNTAGAC